MSRNRFCDFLADPDSRSFSRFTLLLTGAGRRIQEGGNAKAGAKSAVGDPPETPGPAGMSQHVRFGRPGGETEAHVTPHVVRRDSLTAS